MWALVTAGIGLATQMMKEDEKGAEGGAGSAALANVQKFAKAEEVSREKLIEPSESTSEEQRNAYLARMVRAIQNNETEGASAMDSVAASLMADMRNTEGGRIPDQPVVQPQQSSASKFVHGFKGERPEEPVFTFLHSTDQPLHQGAGRVPPTDEEKERSSFVNLPESFF